MDYYTVNGGSSLDVFWASSVGAETADASLFSRIADTLTITR